MQIIKPNTNINFVGHKNLAMIFSWILIMIGIFSMVSKGGLNYGLDFAGGSLVQVKMSKVTTAAEMRETLSPLELKGMTIQQVGDLSDEFLIKAQESSSKTESLANNIQQALEGHYGTGTVDIRRAEMVGPQVGKELRYKGMMAIVYAIIGMLIYITFRFEFRFGVGVVIALLHDVLITLAIFSVLNKEIDLTVVAAFLTIVGYSVNDSVIICDRIRENMARHVGHKLDWIINRSLNDTLSRTVMTSAFTMLSLLSLYFLGGDVLRNFSLAMIIGIIVGTHSSIFVAAPVILYFDKDKDKDVTVPAAVNT
jgi:preprotein translocase subunit SecF